MSLLIFIERSRSDLSVKTAILKIRHIERLPIVIVQSWLQICTQNVAISQINRSVSVAGA